MIWSNNVLRYSASELAVLVAGATAELQVEQTAACPPLSTRHALDHALLLAQNLT